MQVIAEDFVSGRFKNAAMQITPISPDYLDSAEDSYGLSSVAWTKAPPRSRFIVIVRPADL